MLQFQTRRTERKLRCVDGMVYEVVCASADDAKVAVNHWSSVVILGDSYRWSIPCFQGRFEVEKHQ
jgi:hypothetical protein